MNIYMIFLLLGLVVVGSYFYFGPPKKGSTFNKSSNSIKSCKSIKKKGASRSTVNHENDLVDDLAANYVIPKEISTGPLVGDAKVGKIGVAEVRVETRSNYVVSTKMKGELSQWEYEALLALYNQTLTRGGESFESGMKENSRVFIAHDPKGSALPVGQAALLLLDTHDFWGAFSKIRNLNLDMNSVILYNVCVKPEYRRQGIGEQLLKAVHTWASQNNKPNIILFVDPTNTSAINLYERMNYSKDLSYYAPDSREIMMRTKL